MEKGVWNTFTLVPFTDRDWEWWEGEEHIELEEIEGSRRCQNLHRWIRLHQLLRQVEQKYIDPKILSLWWSTSKPFPFWSCSGPDTGSGMSSFLNSWEFTEFVYPAVSWIMSSCVMGDKRLLKGKPFPTRSAAGSRYKQGKCPKSLSASGFGERWWNSNFFPLSFQ